MAKGSRPAMKNAATIVVEAYCPICERSFPEALDQCPDDGARLVRLTQQEVDLVGKTFGGRFNILDMLGDGGMGAVYRARDSKKSRDVAVKVIRTELTNDIDVAKRFLREARLSSGLSHPNTVSVYDYGQTEEGVLFLSMELLKGPTLEEVLVSHGRLAPGRVALIGAQIFDALACAHDQGVVHRDLKPSNIMLVKGADGKERVKVLDFGLAKSLGSDFNTTAGFLMGTPAYLAPEIILQGDVNVGADLYAVGVLLYEILSGKVPFEDDEIPAVLMAHAHRPPPPLPPDIPESMSDFVMQLLAKKPKDRFASAQAAKRGLLAGLEDLTDVDKQRVAPSETDKMVKLEPAPWQDGDDDEEVGTLRRPPIIKRPASSGRLTAERDVANPDTDPEVPLGKGRRRAFIPSKTKLLTPVPPLRAMHDEVMAAVAGDEMVTQEMAALLGDDTDEIEAEEEPDTDIPDTFIRGTAKVSRPKDPERLPDTVEFDALKGAPVVYNKEAPGIWDGIESSTAVVDRSLPYRVQNPGEPNRWMWILFAVGGLIAGAATWWLLGV